MTATETLAKHKLAFLLALQFLTVVPLATPDRLDKAALGLSLLYYPVVGLLLGLSLLGIGALGHLFFSDVVTAVLVVTAWVVLTGALHIDGLADSADAWVGGLGSRERTLSIMKDLTSGPLGVVAIVLVLLLKLAAIYELQLKVVLADELLVGVYIGWLVALPALARFAALLLLLTTDYVSQAGLGEVLVANMP